MQIDVEVSRWVRRVIERDEAFDLLKGCELGLAGVYVGPADLAISMGVDVTKANTDPDVRAAIVRIREAATAAGLVPAVHAGNGQVGNAMAKLGFQMITVGAESQALRRGAALGLEEAKGDR